MAHISLFQISLMSVREIPKKPLVSGLSLLLGHMGHKQCLCLGTDSLSGSLAMGHIPAWGGG